MFKSLLLHTPKFKTPLCDGITWLKFNYSAYRLAKETPEGGTEVF